MTNDDILSAVGKMSFNMILKIFLIFRDLSLDDSYDLDSYIKSV